MPDKKKQKNVGKSPDHDKDKKNNGKHHHKDKKNKDGKIEKDSKTEKGQNKECKKASS